jgi:hypothetical protein
VIEQTRASDLRLDLRHFFKGLEDYRQAKAGHAETPWRVLVKSSLQKSIPEFLHPSSKHEEIEQQRQFVLQSNERFRGDVERQLRAFRERFTLGKTTFYDRRRELKAAGLIE